MKKLIGMDYLYCVVPDQKAIEQIDLQHHRHNPSAMIEYRAQTLQHHAYSFDLGRTAHASYPNQLSSQNQKDKYP